MGPQDPQQLAEHIYRSIGPSGLNKDYLLCLEKALDHLNPESGDQHIKDLAIRIRMIDQQADIGAGSAVKIPVNSELKKVGSMGEQEETEK